MHPPRSPATARGTHAFLWALFLGAFIFAGMLAINVSMMTSLVTGIVCGFVIFLAVSRFGAGSPRHAAKSRGRSA